MYFEKIGKSQSMFRKIKCWDNTSLKTFFGHKNDDLEYKSYEHRGMTISPTTIPDGISRDK